MGALADIGWLRAAFLSYAIGRLIMNYEMYREDQGKNGAFEKFLTVVSYVFFILGIVPTAIVHITQIYPRKRIRDAAYKEGREAEARLK